MVIDHSNEELSVGLLTGKSAAAAALGENGTYRHGNTHLIELRDVVKVYRSRAGEFQALKGVSLSVDAGEFVAVIGKSGSGKSTLINMITGIDRPTSGEIYVGDTAVHTLKERQLARWRGQPTDLRRDLCRGYGGAHAQGAADGPLARAAARRSVPVLPASPHPDLPCQRHAADGLLRHVLPARAAAARAGAARPCRRARPGGQAA